MTPEVGNQNQVVDILSELIPSMFNLRPTIVARQLNSATEVTVQCAAHGVEVK